MANSSTAIRSKVVATFDSTGASDPITVDSGFLVDLSIDMDGGSFTGTIQLQRWTMTGAANAGQWVTMEEYTASTEKVLRSANLRRYRLNCSAVSAGEARCELTAGNRE